MGFWAICYVFASIKIDSSWLPMTSWMDFFASPGQKIKCVLESGQRSLRDIRKYCLVFKGGISVCDLIKNCKA